jgi:hypothetical protein
MNGQAVAARMLWVGLDVVRQEVCSGRDGEERSGEVWRGRNLQRCGGEGTHVECLGSRGGDRTGTDGWGLKRSGKMRQSRSLTDSTGAVWWGDLWFGSPG